MTAPAPLPTSDYPAVSRRVAGVFKGGGAKGIVYVGALRELRARGIWFATVAGSSAGAITATMVAIGTGPDEMRALAPEALRVVPRNVLRGFLPWESRSLFRTTGLRAWLEEQLAEAVGHTDGPVTFAQLARASDIELNVVAMDLHRKQPIVFNATCTPHCSVAAAVVASCAIPLAMPAGRVIFPADDRAAADIDLAIGTDPAHVEVHRLVDGGAWANYPAFVYDDDSFRAYHGLPPLPDGVVTLGFVIEGEEEPDEPVPSPPRPRAPDPAAVRTPSPNLSQFDRGSGRRAGVFGALLSWAAARWVVGVLVPAIACVVLTAWLVVQSRQGFSAFDRLDPRLAVPAILATGLVILMASYLAATIAVAQARLAYEAFDVGIPSLTAALSVGTGVPDWVGTAPDDRVVRLWAPTGISTTSFTVAPRVAALAIRSAESAAAVQLDEHFDEDRVGSDRVPPTPMPPVLPVTGPLTRPRKALIWLMAVAAGVLLAQATTNPAVAIWTFVVGPAFAGIFWVFAKESGGPTVPIDADLTAAQVRDQVRGEVYAPSRTALGLRAFVFTIVAWFAVTATVQGGEFSWTAYVVSYALVLGVGVWFLRALVYRRQVNQGLLLEDRLAGAARDWRTIAAGVVLAGGGTAATVGISTDDLQRRLGDGDLGGAAGVAALVALIAIGLGLVASGIARVVTRRNYLRYLVDSGRRRDSRETGTTPPSTQGGAVGAER